MVVHRPGGYADRRRTRSTGPCAWRAGNGLGLELVAAPATRRRGSPRTTSRRAGRSAAAPRWATAACRAAVARQPERARHRGAPRVRRLQPGGCPVGTGSGADPASTAATSCCATCVDPVFTRHAVRRSAGHDAPLSGVRSVSFSASDRAAASTWRALEVDGAVGLDGRDRRQRRTLREAVHGRRAVQALGRAGRSSFDTIGASGRTARDPAGRDRRDRDERRRPTGRCRSRPRTRRSACEPAAAPELAVRVRDLAAQRADAARRAGAVADRRARAAPRTGTPVVLLSREVRTGARPAVVAERA